ncbi:uncharacterized protein L201_002234 [Kwoniella dendrophila CBS 6074]|uniref:F-box domain-containing protein n=1 Tax=Kwoniella dendrophila CBS 6074 TaxID=1295534 RepID=A0AAX4JRZ3_9TREE
MVDYLTAGLLLPSAIPEDFGITYKNRKHTGEHPNNLNSSYLKAPRNGISPITKLPAEILLSILSYLELDDLLSMTRVSKNLHQLCLSPALHRRLNLKNIPEKISNTLRTHILPAVRELTVSLNVFPHHHYYRYSEDSSTLFTPSNHIRYKKKISHKGNYAVSRLLDCNHKELEESILAPILEFIKLDQVVELNIPFSSSYLSFQELQGILYKLNSGIIQRLNLKGSSLSGEQWIKTLRNRFDNLIELDLSYTEITSLHCLKTTTKLKKLSISSCNSISTDLLSDFLKYHLPISVEELDLSRLDQIPLNDLMNLRVVYQVINDQGEMEFRPAKMKQVKLIGIDHLTKKDIRKLKRNWEKQRNDCTMGTITKLKADLIDWTNREAKTPNSESYHRSLLSTPSFSTIFSRISDNLYTPYTPNSTTSPIITPLINDRKIILPTQHTFLQSLSSSSSNNLDLSSVDNSPNHATQNREQNCEEDAVSIEIIHSAILESDDEDGYRKFIGAVVGGSLELDTRVKDGWDEGQRGYIEIDQ